MDINKIYTGDALEKLKALPDKSINCCVTSPPYYGLRDYGMNDQIGLECSPDIFVDRLLRVFREVRRVLTDDGTIWVNMGDSYAGSGKGAANYPENAKNYLQGTNAGTLSKATSIDTTKLGYKPKDLIGIPWMLAFALRSDGWFLRQDIIWHKPNPMPEPVLDRCTKSHEYLFLLSKNQRYYFDQNSIRTPLKETSISRLAQDLENQNGSDRAPGKTNGKMKAVRFGGTKYGDSNDPKHNTKSGNAWEPKSETANKKSVWQVATKPFKDAHFATFPPDLIIDCIKAGCPENGVVLDPFFGSGTTGVVARKLNRNFIGIELNPEYVKIAENRLYKELGCFM